MAEGLTAATAGPVDIAVIAFDGNQFNGDVAPALRELHESGSVRILDLAFVHKDHDGTVSTVEIADSDVAERFEKVTGAEFDLLSDKDLATVGVGLAANSSALVVVWENSWAARLAAAVRESQGEVVLLQRIPYEDVTRAFAALDGEDAA